MPWNGSYLDTSLMHSPRHFARATAIAVLALSLPLVAALPAQAARQKAIRIADASIVEGDAGSQSLTFSVTWTGSKGGAAPSVQYATGAATATAGTDYTTTGGTANLTNGGCRCATVSVPVKGDATTEGTETFVVDLSNAIGGTIADAQAVGTIYDNEGDPALVVADTSANEGGGPLSFTVQLTNDSASTVTVGYATSDGGATVGSDYTGVSDTLTFSPGQTSKTVQVVIDDDGTAEDDETVLLGLSSPTNASIVDAQGIGTIVNDDADPTVSIDDVSVLESAGLATLTVTLSAASGRETAVDYATSDGSAIAGDDFTTSTGTLTFAAGETSATFAVPIADDDRRETDESLDATLSGEVNLTLGTPSGTVTITDDDPVPTVSAANATVGESEAVATVTISLTNPTVDDVTVDWTTVDGTASSGADYETAGGIATILAGDTSTTVDVPLLGDPLDEPAETFVLSLSGASNAALGTGATVTLADDDLTPTVLTVKAVKARTTVKARGLLEPATGGLTVKVTLLKKQGTKYVKVAVKPVSVKGLKDRDGDGKTDGAYLASFAKPAKGSYRFKVVFAGTGQLKKSAKTVTFKV